METKKSKPVYGIEVNDVFYIYAVGIQWVAIATRSDYSQWGRLPEWCKVCFAVGSPVDKAGQLLHRDDLENMIRAAIKRRVHGQRKAYDSQAAGNKPLAKRKDEQGQKATMLDPDRKRRQAFTPNLFEQSDNVPA